MSGDGSTLVVVSEPPQDRLSHAIKVTGKVILYLDLIWAIAWLVTAIIVSIRVTPVPPIVIPGLPLTDYDGTVEYRATHRALAFHFMLPSVYFSLATGTSAEVMTIWYAFPMITVVFTDLVANLEIWVHLSQDAIPEFFVIEAVLATTALVLSVLVFVWYQTAYWHMHWTGKRFDHTPPPPGRESLVPKSAQIRVPYFSAPGAQPRLRLPGFRGLMEQDAK